MTYRKQLIARKHRSKIRKNEEKQKSEKATALHKGHLIVKGKPN